MYVCMHVRTYVCMYVYHHALKIGLGKACWKLREREEGWLLLLTLKEGCGSYGTQENFRGITLG